MTVQNTGEHELPKEVKFIKDGNAFIRKVSDTVEEVIVSNDILAATYAGIETSMLWVRL